MSTRTFSSTNDNDYEFVKKELHKIEYSTYNEYEEGHKCNEKLMKVIDEGDRIAHPIEYSDYHEDEPAISLNNIYSNEPKFMEYSSYMEEEGE